MTKKIYSIIFVLLIVATAGCIETKKENKAPKASFSFDNMEPIIGEMVTFDARNSTDPDGNIASYEWDFDGDGIFELKITNTKVSHIFNKTGNYNITLKVVDNKGKEAKCSHNITVRDYPAYKISKLLKDNKEKVAKIEGEVSWVNTPWEFGVCDGTGGIKIYAEKNASREEVKLGYKVSIYGLYTLWYGKPEIKIRANTYDRVLVLEKRKINYTVYTIALLLENPEKYNGTNVKVESSVVVYYCDTWLFRITDDSTKSTNENIVVYGGNVSLAFGKLIDVQGEFGKYNESWEIKIRDYSDDGIFVIGDSSPYKLKNIADLLSNVDVYNQSLVIVEGEVSWVSAPWEFGVDDGTGEIKIYAEKNASREEVKLGYKVSIYGFYTLFYGKPEIKIRAKTYDKVLVLEKRKMNYTVYTIALLLENPEKYNGTNVKVESGVVVYYCDTWLFRITDDSTKSTNENIIIYGGNVSLAVGKLINVQGEFGKYNESLEIRIRDYSDDCIAVIGDKSPYKLKNIAELLSAPNIYNESLVRIENATVVYVKGKLFKISDGVQNLTVYSEENITITNGSKVSVQGIFVWYDKGSYWEIKLRANTLDRVE
ncbi:MAG: PKD domain-containing protein [Candidatus Thermoplasmatota archaeon]